MFSYLSRALARAFPALARAFGAQASWPLGLEYRSKTPPLPCLWPLGRPETLPLPCFGHSGAGRAARSVPQGRSNGPLEPPLGAPKAHEGAARLPARCPQGARRGARALAQGGRRGCSSLLGDPGGSTWLLTPLLGTPCALRAALRPPAPLLCHWAVNKAFENDARRICPQLHLSSVALHSAAHYTVHGYARAHTSI